MPIPQLTVYRRDKHSRALITLVGEIDLATEHLVRASLERCLCDGIRTIDIDLTAVTFCDVTGLNAFLYASWATAASGGSLRLHHPRPALARIIALTGNGTRLLGVPGGPRTSSPVLRHVSDPKHPQRIASALPNLPGRV